VERRGFRFFGRVQGVGFRATARDVALELGLTGFVRNLDDGSVEAEASGQVDRLERFLQRLHHHFGPKIHDVQSSTLPPEGDSEFADTFEIRY
jgi:acylphosphatase